MKANIHDYDNIFSACVLYEAHYIFIAINTMAERAQGIATSWHKLAQ